MIVWGSLSFQMVVRCFIVRNTTSNPNFSATLYWSRSLWGTAVHGHYIHHLLGMSWSLLDQPVASQPAAAPRFCVRHALSGKCCRRVPTCRRQKLAEAHASHSSRSFRMSKNNETKPRTWNSFTTVRFGKHRSEKRTHWCRTQFENVSWFHRIDAIPSKLVDQIPTFAAYIPPLVFGFDLSLSLYICIIMYIHTYNIYIIYT